ncbi:UNVERIFIED_ORG: hypothetical protein M2348_001059 [Sphingomonas sp. R1F5B]
MTQWTDWLGQLAAAGKGPVPITDVVRGKAWSWGINLDADFSGATMAGEVRAAPDAAGSPLATFTVSSPVVADGMTRFTVSLDASATGGLPADADGNGVEAWPYMLFLMPSGGTQELLVGGLLTAIGSV